MVAVATNEAARKQGIKPAIWFVALPRSLAVVAAASRTSPRVAARMPPRSMRRLRLWPISHEGLNHQAWFGLALI